MIWHFCVVGDVLRLNGLCVHLMFLLQQPINPNQHKSSSNSVSFTDSDVKFDVVAERLPQHHNYTK